MRPLWKGAISFGLVNIPVGLYSATNRAQTIDLDLLRDSDHSRIRYRKVAEADGKEVPMEHIVKGYEYEKGKYVVLKPDDFQSVQIKSNQTVDIKEFVNVADIQPRFFDQPYFLAPEKNGTKAYVLLKTALEKTGLAGIAKVVIRPPREHLALLKPLNGILMLETLHFAEELRDPKRCRSRRLRFVEGVGYGPLLVNTMRRMAPSKYPTANARAGRLGLRSITVGWPQERPFCRRGNRAARERSSTLWICCRRASARRAKRPRLSPRGSECLTGKRHKKGRH